MCAIELEVLTGVEHVEPAHPEANRKPQEPRLPAAAAARRQPAADRRYRHRQSEKRLRVCRVPLRERIPEDDRERDRR